MARIQLPPDMPANFEAEYREVVQQIDRSREAARLAQIALARRDYLYWKGHQYLSPVFDAQRRILNWNIEQGAQDTRLFRSVYNIVFSDGLKYIGVALQRSHGVKAVPDDPDDEDQVSAAKDHDGLARYLHRLWNINRLVFRLSFHQWTTGPSFLYTRFVVDPRFGTTDVPETTLQKETAVPEGFMCPRCQEPSPSPVCPACGAPGQWMPEVSLDVPVETMRPVPMGAADLKLYSVFHVAIPFEATCPEECWDLCFSELLTKWQARGLYENVREDWLSSGPHDSVTYEADRALQDVQMPARQFTDREKDAIQHERRYLRSEVFNAFTPETRAWLRNSFPGGAMVARIGDKIAEIASESMDDYWAICPTKTGEQLTSDPLCRSTIPVQDDTNQFWNMGKEIILRSIPKTLADSRLLDSTSVNERNLVQEIIRVNLAGEDINKLIGQLPMGRFSDQMMPFWESLRAYTREANGIMPAIFGGGETAPTWRQAAQQKNQSLMQLQTPLSAQDDAIAKATENGCRQTAASGYGSVKVAPNQASDGGWDLDSPETVNLETLQVRGWHIEAVSSVPMTEGEKAERFEGLAKENPGLIEALGALHPINIPRIQKRIGLEDLYVVGSQEQEAVERRIRRLLNEVPTVDFDQMTGQQIEQSSIPPDEFTDKNHAAIADMIRAFCLSKKAEKMQEQNPLGMRNVWLHGMEQERAAMMAAMPPVEAAPEGAPVQQPVQ